MTGPADLDSIDLELLRVLQDDGRIAISDLAHRVHVSRANAYTRLQRLNEAGVLKGFMANIDRAKVGLGIHAMVLVSLETWPDREAIRERLRSMPEIEFAGITTGQFDLVLLARLRDVDELRDFTVERIPEIPGVRSTVTAIIMEETVPSRAVLPKPQTGSKPQAKVIG